MMTVEEELNSMVAKVIFNVLLSTPIINFPNPPSAFPVGCGLYLKIQNDYFLISAGHLLNLEDWHKLISPGIGDTMVWLRGKIVTSFENEKSDRLIDFGILKFAPHQIQYLINGNHNFLNSNKLLVNHHVNEDNMYVIAGYPLNGIKKKSGKAEFTPIPMKMVTYSIPNKKYEENGFNPEHFILLKYQRKLAPFNLNEKQITKELKGISGSGLWYIPNWRDLNADGIPKHYLVGIMTRNHKNKGFLVAIKIDFITETINQTFGLPVFETTNFNFGELELFGSE